MPLLTPPPAAPQRGDRTTFANRVDAFITWLINFVTELVALVSNLNSIAAGGAYSLPYRLSYTTNFYGKPDGGWIYWSGTGTAYVDAKTSSGANILAALSSAMSSSSAVKAQVRLVNVANPSSFTNIDIVGYTVFGNSLAVQLNYVVTASNGSFNEGDAVLLQITRTGDKGDQGPAGSNGNMQLLASTTVGAAVANIDYLNLFTSAYDKYVIEVQGATASAADQLFMRLAKAGAVDAATSYQWANVGGSASAFSGMFLSPGSTNQTTVTVEVRNANDAVGQTGAGSRGFALTTGGTSGTAYEGAYVPAAAVTGFRLYWSGGANFTKATVRVFGIKNS